MANSITEPAITDNATGLETRWCKKVEKDKVALSEVSVILRVPVQTGQRGETRDYGVFLLFIRNRQPLRTDQKGVGAMRASRPGTNYAIENMASPMSYIYESENGQRLVVENDGDHTQIGLSSGSEGQQQSQATGFETGKWSNPPALYRLKRDLVLRLETKDGTQFIRMRGSEVRRLQSEPDLGAAEKLPLSKSDRPPRMRPMEPMKPMEPMRPMEPMKPMEPMRPLEPMEPMEPMQPMEMRMGDMHMSMGGTESRTEVTQRFCTQCGQPVNKGDRFCGQCGHPLGKQE
jgi:hypothetical protein